MNEKLDSLPVPAVAGGELESDDGWCLRRLGLERAASEKLLTRASDMMAVLMVALATPVSVLSGFSVNVAETDW